MGSRNYTEILIFVLSEISSPVYMRKIEQDVKSLTTSERCRCRVYRCVDLSAVALFSLGSLNKLIKNWSPFRARF